MWHAMLSLSLYHWTDELSSRKLCNRAFHLSDAKNSPITQKDLSRAGKNTVWGKLTLKWMWSMWRNNTYQNPVFIEATITPSITMITSCWAWLAVVLVFPRERSSNFVLENKGTTICSINTFCQHKHWGDAVSERRLQSWCHVMFSHLLCSEWLAWFCLPQPFYFHLHCQHQC